jgi:hypothetical protein
MHKNVIIILLGIVAVNLIGCSIKTPEIRGVVLDEETKHPVEGAWVSATIGVKTKTVGGDVGQVVSLDPPHTRTSREGRFVIPRKKLKKPSFPVSFGSEIDSLGIGARTVDDKCGGIDFKGEKLKEFLKKAKWELTIYIKPIERNEIEYFSHLQSLYKYCLTGRFGIEVPPVEGGCDEWELDYVIAKHEKYLERYKDHVEKEVNTVIFDHLAYLYEKRGNFNKAIETLKRSIALIERKGLLKFEVWQRNKKEIEWKIEELHKNLEGVKR